MHWNDPMEPPALRYEEELRAREEAEYEDYLEGVGEAEIPMSIGEWREHLRVEANKRDMERAANAPPVDPNDDIPF